MLSRVAKLLLTNRNQIPALVRKSYDRISSGYDETWTTHMRGLTAELINSLDIQHGMSAMDLTCGTGYATGMVAEHTQTTVVGVDASEGMLKQAKQSYPDLCRYIQADILDYLKTVPAESFDLVTCCWGLGYSKPLKVLRQIRRVLKVDGRLGIIDNTLFSLREVMYCSLLAFMEQPEKLENLMKFRFLTGRRHLRMWMRLAGLKPVRTWDGKKPYKVDSGAKAIERLRATGAAAGFEYAASPEDSEMIFERFAEILEQKYKHEGQIPIIHRYLGGIAVK